MYSLIHSFVWEIAEGGCAHVWRPVIYIILQDCWYIGDYSRVLQDSSSGDGHPNQLCDSKGGLTAKAKSKNTAPLRTARR